MPSLSELMFQSASQNVRDTKSDPSAIPKAYKGGFELALQQQELMAKREKLKEAKRFAHLKQSDLYAESVMEGANIPEKMRAQYIDNKVIPRAEALGRKADKNTLMALYNSTDIDRGKLAGYYDSKGDIENSELWMGKLQGVLGMDPKELSAITLKTDEQIVSEKKDERDFVESQRKFKINKQSDFIKEKRKLFEERRESITDIDIKINGINKGWDSLMDAAAQNNGPMLNQAIKNIVKQTDNRITDKDFELIATRLGYKGLMDKVEKAAGRVPRGLVKQVIQIVQKAREEQMANREAVLKQTRQDIEGLAQTPYATQDIPTMMNEFAAGAAVRDAKGNKNLPETGESKNRKGDAENPPLSTFFNSGQVDSFVTTNAAKLALANPPLSKDNVMMLIRQSKPELSPLATEQLATKLYEKAYNNNRKPKDGK